MEQQFETTSVEKNNELLNEQKLVDLSEIKFSLVSEKTLETAPVTMQTQV